MNVKATSTLEGLIDDQAKVELWYQDREKPHAQPSVQRVFPTSLSSQQSRGVMPPLGNKAVCSAFTRLYEWLRSEMSGRNFGAQYFNGMRSTGRQFLMQQDQVQFVKKQQRTEHKFLCQRLVLMFRQSRSTLVTDLCVKCSSEFSPLYLQNGEQINIWKWWNTRNLRLTQASVWSWIPTSVSSAENLGQKECLALVDRIMS